MTHLVCWARRVRFAHTRRAVVALTTLGLSVALVAAFLVVGPTFAAPPSPSISLSPRAAAPGANVTVTGANFNCKSVNLAFDGASVGTASPTKKAFSATITVPNSAIPGEHMVTASCGGQKSDKSAAQATFTVLRPIIVSGDLNFGAVAIGDTSATRDVTVSNTGTSPLTVTDVHFVGNNTSDFIVQGPVFAQIDPSSQLVWKTSFKPTAVGHRTATFRIVSNDPYTPAFDLPAQGTGTLTPTLTVRGSFTTDQVFQVGPFVTGDTADPNTSNNHPTLVVVYVP